MKNNPLSNLDLWKIVLCFLLAIFCESSFAFLDPIAIRSGQNMVVHMQRTEVPCPPAPRVTTCDDYMLYLTAFLPNYNTFAFGSPEIASLAAPLVGCLNGICPEQDVTLNDASAGYFSIAEVQLQLSIQG